MIWVITSPERIHEEERIITDLLSAGVPRILLRKPGWTAEQYATLLDAIDPGSYDHILIRDQPLLAGQYGLAGVHWSREAKALHESKAVVAATSSFKENSTGIHAADEITLTNKRYQTLLLSPVFNSISKPGYQGRAGGTLTHKDNRQVLALGGVDHTNIFLLKQWQFDGAALLGAIWHTPAKAVEHYCHIQQLWNKSDLT
jgi:thiamine-phosphate pyrophosphorylase